MVARATLSNRHDTDSNSMGAKVGIIGCGRWGTVHLNTLNILKQSGIVSEIHACDLIPEKETELNGLIDTFSLNWKIMVQSTELDVVAIVTPVETHCELALAILDYCNVLFIEKPIGLTELEANSIIHKTKQLGGRLLIGHILRFHDLINRANLLVSKGEIGDLQRVDFSRITTRSPPKNPNVFDALAIHGIDTACFCFNESEPKRATIDNLLFDNKAQPINTRISLEFPGIKEASIDVGWNGESEIRELIYSGSKGKIVVEMNDANSIELTTNEYQQSIIVDNLKMPLIREWEYIIEQSNDTKSTIIYPPPKSILKCVKWLETIKYQMNRVQLEN